MEIGRTNNLSQRVNGGGKKTDRFSAECVRAYGGAFALVLSHMVLFVLTTSYRTYRKNGNRNLSRQGCAKMIMCEKSIPYLFIPEVDGGARWFRRW